MKTQVGHDPDTIRTRLMPRPSCEDRHAKKKKRGEGLRWVGGVGRSRRAKKKRADMEMPELNSQATNTYGSFQLSGTIPP